MSAPGLRPNPYVGLRPFFIEDSLYFFGRDAQTAELLDVLREHRFLAVVGSSGSGKSSLVRAGLLPALLGGFLVHDRDRWRKVQMKPGDAPLANLAAGLLKAMDEPSSPEAAQPLRDAIHEGHTDAVVEFLRTRLEPNANLFLLVDQFEEIFAFRGVVGEDDVEQEVDATRRRERAQRRAEAADFVDLILGLAAQRDQPIYVALTMRTDFLGDCDLFYGLPEALNLGRYLVPRLSREQLREAVECPATLAEASISPRLSDYVLNELGDRFDRLPVLQHALMRTWDAWKAAGGVGPIDLEHFEAMDGLEGELDQSAGGLEGALDKDAEGALRGLDLEITKKIFQRLTDTDASLRRVRSPARISELMAVTGAERRVVEEIVRRFEEDGRSFLHRSDDGRKDDPRVDISHESLIRQWNRLRHWVDDERLSRDLYKKLVERSQSGTLLQDPELQRMLDWSREANPSAVWARRYSAHDADFDQATRYLDASEAKRTSDINDKLLAAEAERQEERRKLEEAIERADEQKAARLRQRTYLRWACAALAVAVAGLAFAWIKSAEATAEREARAATNLALAAGNVELGLPRALLFGAAGVLHGETFQTRENLRKVLLAEPHLDAFLSAPQSAETADNSAFVNALAVSPDGSTLASGSEDGTVTLWDVAKNQQLGERLEGHQFGVTSLAFSPDGQRLVSGSADKTAIVWDVARRLPLTTFKSHTEYVSSVAFSPDGRTLASGSWDGTLRLWDVEGRQVGEPLTPGKGRDKRDLPWIVDTAFSADGSTIAAVDMRGQLWLWNPTTRRPVRPFEDAKEFDDSPLNASSIAFSPDGTLFAAASRGGSVTIWNIETRKQVGQHVAHEGSVSSVAFSADSMTVATAGSDGISLVDFRTGTRGRLDAQSDVASIAFLSSGNLASAGDGAIILWDVPSRQVRTLGRHPAPVRSVAFSPDGRLVAAGDESGRAALWDLATPGTPREAGGDAGHKDYVRGVAFSPDGKVLATASEDNTVMLWNVEGHTPRRVLTGHTEYVTSVAFSPDGALLASGSHDKTIRLWDTVSGQTLRVLSGHEFWVTSVAFSRDGKTLASGSEDQTARLWDVASGQQQGTPFEHTSGATRGVTSVAFSPDGTILASASDKTVSLWDVASRASIGLLSGHRRGVRSIAFSPDGRTLASGSDDYTLRLWDVEQRLMLGKPAAGHFGAVTSVAFSPDGRTLASGSDDGSIVLWDEIRWKVDVGSWLKKVCRAANRNLTEAEWNESVGADVPYRIVCENLPVP